MSEVHCAPGMPHPDRPDRTILDALASRSRDHVVCVLCGRVGTRGFVILSGNGDGTRDSWRCANSAACAKRASDAEVDAMTDEQVVEALLQPSPSPETGV